MEINLLPIRIQHLVVLGLIHIWICCTSTHTTSAFAFTLSPSPWSDNVSILRRRSSFKYPGNLGHWCPSKHAYRLNSNGKISMALGEYSVSITKPLGIVLEECDTTGNGVQVASTTPGGAADQNGIIRGDVLLQIFDRDVTTSDFDTVMGILVDSPTDKEIHLTFSDGLGRMDIAPNLAKTLDVRELLMADQVVRAAVREIRKRGVESTGGSGLGSGSIHSLGDLLRVEIVIGAGVRKDGSCMVRFFAIFSRDGVTTFSCSVSATGVHVDENDGTAVDIVALSCAKDEGWGQTVDLIVAEST